MTNQPIVNILNVGWIIWCSNYQNYTRTTGKIKNSKEGMCPCMEFSKSESQSVKLLMSKSTSTCTLYKCVQILGTLCHIMQKLRVLKNPQLTVLFLYFHLQYIFLRLWKQHFNILVSSTTDLIWLSTSPKKQSVYKYKYIEGIYCRVCWSQNEETGANAACVWTVKNLISASEGAGII